MRQHREARTHRIVLAVALLALVATAIVTTVAAAASSRPGS